MTKIPSFHKFLEEEKKKENNVSLENTSNSIKIPSFNEYVNNQSYYDDIANKVYKQNELVRQAQENQRTREEETNSSILDRLKYANPVYALYKLPENAKKAVEAGKNFFSQSFFKEGEGNVLQNIGGTIADTGLNVAKGFLNYAEDVADFGVYKIADLAEFTGNKTTAEGLRSYADVRAVNALFGENEKNTENLNLRYLPEAIKTGKIENEVVPEKTLQERIDKYSYFDKGMDDVAQNVGQLFGTMGTSELIGKIGLTKSFEETLVKHGVNSTVAQDYAKSLNTALSSYSSAYGGTYESVRRAGYGDEEARKVARISGFVEAISEQLHDGIPGTKTAGWADKIIKIDNPKLKIFFNALGEVDEEAFGSILSTVINDIRFNLDPDNPYLQDINLYSGDILKDVYYNTFGDDAKAEYLTVFLSTLITNGMSTVGQKMQERNQQNPLLKSENLNQGQPIEQVKSQPETKVEQKVQNVSQVAEEQPVKQTKKTQQEVDELHNSDSFRRRTMREIQSLVSEEEYNDLLNTINERDMSDEELERYLDEVKGIDTDEKKAQEVNNPDSYRRTTMKEIQELVSKEEYNDLVQRISEQDMSDEELGNYLERAKQNVEEDISELEPEETVQEQPKKTTDLLQISKLTKEDANITPKLPKKKYNKVGDGLSDQVNTLPNTQLISEEQKKKILEEEEFRTYDKITNKESLDKAFDRLNKNGKAEVNKWFNKNPNNVDATDIAEGAILMKLYGDNNDTEGLVEVAKKFRDMKTKTAQTLQASSILSRLTPEGMVMYAQSELDEAYNELIKNKSKEWIDAHRDALKLTSNDVNFIMDTMKKVSQMPDGYDKKVELAKIQKVITDKIEPDFTKSLKGWMRISMLFNPKTQGRNFGGNALILPVNVGADVVASWADKLIAKKTGLRTTGTFKARNFIEGSKRGAYQSTNDFKLGINTRDMEGNRFEIGEGKSFSDKTILGRGLNRVESVLNYTMDLGDRVFSEGWYENSLQNQMELNGVDTPTQDMIDIAQQEALQRTYNDNNNYTKFVLDIRRALNRIGGKNYGLGDVLIPFAKTPANLTKAIVDYSPAGMVNALLQYKNLNNAISRGDVTSQQQHQFVQTLGKATAGSILYILGYALAKAGIITGEADEDKDTKNFIQNVLGTNQYSIKIGDKSFTYDWAQPISAPMTITANIVNSKKNKEQALLESIVGSLDTAGSVLLEQSFLQSLNDVFSDNDNVVGNLVNEILELPARAVPTFSKQVADMVDGTQRQTYEKNKPIQTAINKFLVKIPGASKTLAPKVNTMGEDVLKYGGKNNIFNVMLNPANVNKENVSEAGKEIYKVYQATGNKNIMPRTAPYTVTMKNNEKVTLTTNQIAKFQRTSGTMIEKSLDKIINTSEYKNLSDDEKASVIKNIVDYSYNYASNQITGKDMASTYNKANIFVNNGGNLGDYYLHKDEADYSIDNPERYKAITSIGKFDDIYGYIKEVNEIKKQVSNDKEATIQYVDKLDLSVPQKAILIKLISSNYKLDNYNVDIINYIDENIDNMEDKIAILNKLGFTVSSDGTVRW